MPKDRYRCKKCKKKKSRKQFYNDRKRHDGITGKCRVCLRRERRVNYRRRVDDDPVKHRTIHLLQASRYRARQNRLPHELDEDWLRAILERGKCEVTGIPFAQKIQSPPHRYCPSIDRIDPVLGYTKDNSRVVCLMVNEIKRDYMDDEIVSVGEALKAWGESRGLSSRLEEQLDEQIKGAGIAEGMVRELRAIEGRRFRVDFCWPDHSLAVEVQGGIWTRGRHSRPMGIVKDYEKFNLLTLGGWRILLLTSLDVQSGRGLEMIQDALREESSSS